MSRLLDEALVVVAGAAAWSSRTLCCHLQESRTGSHFGVGAATGRQSRPAMARILRRRICEGVVVPMRSLKGLPVLPSAKKVGRILEAPRRLAADIACDRNGIDGNAVCFVLLLISVGVGLMFLVLPGVDAEAGIWRRCRRDHRPRLCRADALDRLWSRLLLDE